MIVDGPHGMGDNQLVVVRVDAPVQEAIFVKQPVAPVLIRVEDEAVWQERQGKALYGRVLQGKKDLQGIQEVQCGHDPPVDKLGNGRPKVVEEEGAEANTEDAGDDACLDMADGADARGVVAEHLLDAG